MPHFSSPYVIPLRTWLPPTAEKGAGNLPFVRRAAKNKAVLRRLSVEVFTVAAMGLAALMVDRVSSSRSCY